MTAEYGLTDAQRAVVELAERGMTRAGVAEALSISVEAVSDRMQKAREKGYPGPGFSHASGKRVSRITSVEAQLREARRRSIADVAAAREHLATAVRETERLDAAILAYTGNGNGSLEAL